MAESNKYVSDIKKGKTVGSYSFRADQNSNFRFTMEDAYFVVDGFQFNDTLGLFGVLDGHGGPDVVNFCQTTIPELFQKDYKDGSDIEKYFKTVFDKTDSQLRIVGASEQGSTVCVCFIRNEYNQKVTYIANLGDTRAVMCEKGKATRITMDHKGTNELEQQRIKEKGGVIFKNRVAGSLAVTRALGDFDLKTLGVINVPDVAKIVLSKDHEYLIIATDGLWDVCDDNKAIELTRDVKDLGEMTNILIKYALENGSKDNVSILILKFW